ncbi:MAG: helix-turn-helix domain-containing protein [Ruminococcaceae bacterium]|nr:helix-turn-helix domain-containing protein [Oscillospiraceae bacterium]
MKYLLKDFITPVTVSRMANLHYFEFINEYHTVDDSHDFCELLYVDRGSVTVNADNYKGELSDNQVIIHRPNEMHSLSCKQNIAPNVIIIGFECLCPQLESFSKKPFTLSTEQKKMLADIMKEGTSVYTPPFDLPNIPDMIKREEFPFGADQMIKLKLEAFLISIIRGNAASQHSSKNEVHEQSRIEAIHQYITENYTEKILLDNICFIFGTNKTTLCQDFKNEYKTTVVNYINSLKVKEAKALLRENKLSVTEISEKLGFNSIHYFSRLFKRMTGHTPKEYTKSIRSKFERS